MSIMKENNEKITKNIISTATFGVSPKRKKPYKSKSSVWEHFTKLKKEDGGKAEQATCNYCNRMFGCSSSQGTSTLWRHLEKCGKYPYNKYGKQQLLSFSLMSQEQGSVSNWKFDQELCRKELAMMIIVDELPLNFVEKEGFKIL